MTEGSSANILPAPLPPFVRARSESPFLYDFWVAESTGDAEADLALGRAYAQAAVAYARTLPGGAALIAFVLAEIVRRTRLRDDQDGWIEAGFLTKIAAMAYVGAAN